MTRSNSLLRRFADVVDSVSDRPSVIDDARTLTFAELASSATRIAGALERRGLGGCRIALYASAGTRWVEAFFGIVEAASVVVPLSGLYPPKEQRWFVGASRVSAILTSGDEPLSPDVASGLTVLHIDALRDEYGERQPATNAADPDVALILYTSGTTGRPKGALITHDNIAALAELLGDAWGFTSDDVLLHTLPLHHLHGLGISLMVALLGGASTRILKHVDAERVWTEMARSTVLMAVPTQHKKLFDAFDAADDSSRALFAANARRLRLVTSGSAALSPSLGGRWQALCGRYPLERYGMTEIGVALSNPLHGKRVPGTVGMQLPGMQVRLVSDAGSDVEVGDAGEVWIRGPTVFSGYDADDAATRAAFHDGWFLSGDTATVSADGYVTLLGRTSIDILKSGGYKLSALEIEHVLREHEAISDVAVVGIPDETWGDMVIAAIVAAPGKRSLLDEPSLRHWAKTRLASYKVPKRFVVMDDLPRNTLGKVIKPELAAMLTKIV